MSERYIALVSLLASSTHRGLNSALRKELRAKFLADSDSLRQILREINTADEPFIDTLAELLRPILKKLSIREMLNSAFTVAFWQDRWAPNQVGFSDSMKKLVTLFLKLNNPAFLKAYGIPQRALDTGLGTDSREMSTLLAPFETDAAVLAVAAETASSERHRGFYFAFEFVGRAEFGQWILPAYRKLLGTSSASIRAQTAERLAASKSPEDRELLFKLSKSLRAEAAQVAADLKEINLLGTCNGRDVSKDKQWFLGHTEQPRKEATPIRLALVNAFARWKKSEEAARELIHYVRDADDTVCVTALRALAAFGWLPRVKATVLARLRHFAKRRDRCRSADEQKAAILAASAVLSDRADFIDLLVSLAKTMDVAYITDAIPRLAPYITFREDVRLLIVRAAWSGNAPAVKAAAAAMLPHLRNGTFAAEILKMLARHHQEPYSKAHPMPLAAALADNVKGGDVEQLVRDLLAS